MYRSKGVRMLSLCLQFPINLNIVSLIPVLTTQPTSLLLTPHGVSRRFPVCRYPPGRSLSPRCVSSRAISADGHKVAESCGCPSPQSGRLPAPAQRRRDLPGLRSEPPQLPGGRVLGGILTALRSRSGAPRRTAAGSGVGASFLQRDVSVPPLWKEVFRVTLG